MNTNQQIALAILAAFSVLGILTLIGAYLIVSIGWQEFAETHQEEGREAAERPSGWLLLGRALTWKCPLCGRGRISRSYFTMNSACPVCGSVFWKNEGEWIGPVVIDYTVAVAIALVSWTASVFFGLSEAAQLTIAAGSVIVGGVAIVPWSHSFWTLFLYVSGETTKAKRAP
jgi:uncharacterized protein (DUF983 family)